jgi:L-2-hydroxyglutarate oxidase LhgO
VKARYSVEGNRQLRAYCTEHGIAMQQGGILVVAQTEAERATLAELERRAAANGVEARLLDQRELARLEPHAAGIEALHAPQAASFDAPAYVRSLLADAAQHGAELVYDIRVLEIGNGDRTPVTVRTTTGSQATCG